MPSRRTNLQRASQSRVFTIEDRAGPSHPPVYQALARVLAVAKPFGGITPIRIADPQRYGQFITVDKIRGQPALPSTSLEFRMTRDLSAMLRLANKGCPIDLHIHIGACQDPQDFDRGWEKIGVLEDAQFTEYNTSPLGAMDNDQESSSTETLPVTGTDYYEIGPLGFAAQAASQIVQEVLAVTICDSRSCGACGIPSDGTQRVFALQTAIGASPGLPAELVYTQDGGATWGEQKITSLPANRAPIDLECVGPYLLALSNTDCSAHYALITDVLAGTATWTRQVTGLVCPAGAPNALFSVSRAATWVVGDGGYIYKSTNPETGFSPQTSGDVTVQNLKFVHGIDDENIIAGGAANAILRTRNGGSTWELLTGPAGQAAVAINAGAMISANEWVIGFADGKLFFTIDAGATWTQKTLPGGLTSINDIKFPTRTVGYIAGNTATAGRLLRSVSGGYSWYTLPEGTGQVLPTALKWSSLGATGDDPNTIWAGGLVAANGDGVLVKGAG